MAGATLLPDAESLELEELVADDGGVAMVVRACLCWPFTPSGLIFCQSGRLSARMDPGRSKRPAPR